MHQCNDELAPSTRLDSTRPCDTGLQPSSAHRRRAKSIMRRPYGRCAYSAVCLCTVYRLCDSPTVVADVGFSSRMERASFECQRKRKYRLRKQDNTKTQVKKAESNVKSIGRNRFYRQLRRGVFQSIGWRNFTDLVDSGFSICVSSHRFLACTLAGRVKLVAHIGWRCR
jgi:hypothetical protein